MPEIEDFPEGPPKRSPNTRYPWEEWADGEIRKFVRGEDFQVAPSQFVVACRRYCGRSDRNWTVEAVTKGDSAFIRLPRRSL